ncbi:MAG: tetratricopeptide repeat protein [Sandaracinaceae bacterium]|jgi:tetratricopeptide (TPR) repeat protein|nr:tetratricopeptide repeat protein [Sandaracinaceae bacterium]MBP7681624.1 tetratricopeptide repeat protein [Deltaproteobacteria bacterium]MBK6807675.1 tetratricopeptide repeat protein [Sandaracinaceae bacterium]MBK7155201.1 tetratricopeptide repeat protein [Sandaracinaceae bacterium]MBK7774395.1 tetratricopeptide repeat protein [Sandaracinaceae bacterium]
MSKRLDMFDTMIAKGSKDPFVHYARAMELRSLERFDDALAAYQQVMQAFPDYVPTYLMAGQVAEQLGRPADARAALEAGIAAAQRTGDGHALGELRGLLAGLD